MTEKNEMWTFDNKAYVADENDNGGKPSKKVGRFAQMTDEEKSTAKRGIMKNVVIISFSFMLLFTAFQSMANLQSSINKVSLLKKMTKNGLKGFERKLLDIDILKVGHHKEKFLWNGRTFLVLYAYIGILDVWSLWCKNEGFQFKGIKIKILKNIQGITM